jgi:hypothetical protein
MPRRLQLAAALALTLLPTACSSAGSAGAGPATALVAAERQIATPTEAAISLPAVLAPAPSLVPEGEPPRQRVATPLTALNQMVTTQALLVSLLLAPVSTDAQAAARTESAPRATSVGSSN